MDAVARELVGRHVVSYLARLRGCNYQVPNHLVDLPLGTPDPVGSMVEFIDGDVAARRSDRAVLLDAGGSTSTPERAGASVGALNTGPEANTT